MECPECGKEVAHGKESKKHAVSHWGENPPNKDLYPEAYERYMELVE